jgi:hypothetical protein
MLPDLQTVKSTLVISFFFFFFFFFDCNFYLIFLFDYIFTFCLLFWALILLYLFPSTLWGSLLCRLPPQRQPSVRSAPLSAGGISKNNPRIGQVISRKSVGVSVVTSLSLLFFLPCVSFSRWAVVEKNTAGSRRKD